MSTTRAAYDAKAVNAVKLNYSASIIAINEICESTKLFDVRSKKLGISSQIKSFKLYFSLQMWSPILILVLRVNMYLQTVNREDILNLIHKGL